MAENFHKPIVHQVFRFETGLGIAQAYALHFGRKTLVKQVLRLAFIGQATLYQLSIVGSIFAEYLQKARIFPGICSKTSQRWPALQQEPKKLQKISEGRKYTYNQLPTIAMAAPMAEASSLFLCTRWSGLVSKRMVVEICRKLPTTKPESTRNRSEFLSCSKIT